jgi:hypothetical protein
MMSAARLAEIAVAIHATNDRDALHRLYGEARQLVPDKTWTSSVNDNGKSPRAVQRLLKGASPSPVASPAVASAPSPVAVASAELSPAVAPDNVAYERGDAWGPPAPKAVPSAPGEDPVVRIKAHA